VIAQAQAGGASVIVSTHLLDLAATACEEIVVLRAGRIAAAAPSGELRGEAGRLRYRALLS
jgi:ABC-2 type transport system ATP-binding protein